MKLSSVFLFFVLISTMCSSQLRSGTLYVRVSGSDSNDGLTPQRAFQTIQHAVSQCTEPGTIVYIGPGTYNESVSIGTGAGAAASSGTEEEPIRLIADTSGTHTGDDAGAVLLDGKGHTHGLTIRDRHFWTLEQFTIKNQSTYAIYGYNDGLSVRNCVIHSPTSYAIYLNPSNNTSIEDCDFVRGGSSGHQIIIVPRRTNPFDVLVTRNRLSMEGALYLSLGLKNGGQRVTMPPQRGAHYGIMVTGYNSPSIDRLEVSNNIISDCDVGVYISLHITDPQNYVVANNTIVGSYLSVYMNAYAHSSASIVNNLIQSCYAGIYATSRTSNKVAGVIENNITLQMEAYGRSFEFEVIHDDPLLENPKGGIYALNNGSPGIDTGTSVNAPTVDVDQKSRTKDGNAAPDIGATESSASRKRVRVVRWKEIGRVQ